MTPYIWNKVLAFIASCAGALDERQKMFAGAEALIQEFAAPGLTTREGRRQARRAERQRFYQPRS